MIKKQYNSYEEIITERKLQALKESINDLRRLPIYELSEYKSELQQARRELSELLRYIE